MTTSKGDGRMLTDMELAELREEARRKYDHPDGGQPMLLSAKGVLALIERGDEAERELAELAGENVEKVTRSLALEYLAGMTAEPVHGKHRVRTCADADMELDRWSRENDALHGQLGEAYDALSQLIDVIGDGSLVHVECSDAEAADKLRRVEAIARRLMRRRTEASDSERTEGAPK